jgi:regulator of cell morphogenesis and NO signaling
MRGSRLTIVMVEGPACAHVEGMNIIDATRTVAEITQSVPGAARVFERLGIDYCCRGKEALDKACELAHLPLENVLQTLNSEMHGRALHDAPREPRQLIQYLLERHHTFTRDELARLDPLADKVCRVHGDKHPELLVVRSLFRKIAEDLGPHMTKEERVLFPYIERLADGDPTRPPFGSIQHPLRVMGSEHETVGFWLAELERITNRYTPPEGACGSYHALYTGLRELQADLHEHIHLENHVLFPRALELEQEAG